MSIAGKAVEIGAGAAGGTIGGIIGSFIPPPVLGTLVGRAVGSRVGRIAGRAAGTLIDNYVNSMEEAEEEAEEDEATTAAEEEAVCRECQERCQQIADDINRLMYRNKRGPGNSSGTHGLAIRRAEQICGQYGPGQVRMGYKIKDGIRVLTETWPWETHSREIRIQQQHLRDKLAEYDDGDPNCNDYLPNAFNRQAAERMTQPSFNPSPGEWLGPNHPLCNGLGETIRQNATPELPNFPRPGSGAGAGALTS